MIVISTRGETLAGCWASGARRAQQLASARLSATGTIMGVSRRGTARPRPSVQAQPYAPFSSVLDLVVANAGGGGVEDARGGAAGVGSNWAYSGPGKRNTKESTF